MFSCSLSIPTRSAKHGDFAVPLFVVAKELEKNPVEIAKELETKLSSKTFSKIEPKGPYLNFFLNSTVTIPIVLNYILKNKFNLDNEMKGKKVMVEYLSPNTNKPLTVGHLRNLVLGSTISNLYKKS